MQPAWRAHRSRHSGEMAGLSGKRKSTWGGAGIGREELEVNQTEGGAKMWSTWGGTNNGLQGRNWLG